MDLTLEDENQQKLTLDEPDAEAKLREAFETTRNEACPETYDNTLAAILQQTSEGSGAWLAEQDDVKRWMDPADDASRSLWLCGSPGSGKTHLTANLIHYLKQRNYPVLFAFLSHDQPRTKRDALIILISLLFQAVEAKPALKSMIPDPSYPDQARLLDREEGFVRELLYKVLASMGPVFVVLDELDEVVEGGWGEVLGAVMEMKEKSGAMKVLIASRALEGVTGALEGHGFATVRVDGRNGEDVKRFVRDESRDILLGLGREGASEGEISAIRATLESIADKSEGTFLHAKLILQLIKGCKTLAEIQSELENLPQGVNQAYGRLISRIEGKATTQTHLQAIRSVLMMAACSGRPLREPEMLQFLTIDTGIHDSANIWTKYPNIVEDCGPILQVVDGVVRFIHVTAKEYLLAGQGNNLPKLAEAHLNAALACINYLSSPSLDILFPEPGGAAAIARRMLNGDFVFLTYAVTEYIPHVKAWLDHKDTHASTKAMSAALQQLFDIRRNEGFKHPVPSETFLREFYTPEALTDYKHREGFIVEGPFNPEPPEALMRHFSPLGGDPALQRSLACAAAFMDAAKMGMISVQESDDPSTNDPLTLFPAFGEFRRNLEGAFCHSPEHSAECRCQRLEELYSPQRYYCSKLLCRGYIDGFPTQAARDRHLESGHSRDFRCPDEDCFASRGGMDSRLVRSRHLLASHSGYDNGDDGVSAPLRVLRAAIRAHDLPTVQSLLAEGTVTFPKRHEYLETLSFAARHSSPSILTFLLEPDFFAVHTPPLTLPDLLSLSLYSAIEGPNAPNIRHLLLTLAADPLHRSNYGVPLTLAISSWDPALLRLLVVDCGVAIPADHPATGAGLFSSVHLFGASREELRRRFGEMEPYLPAPAGPDAYAAGPFRAVMGGGPGVMRLSLELGGDPNQTGGQGWRESPLYMMVKSGGGVGMVRMLLEHGADPNAMPGYPYSAVFAAVEKRGGDRVAVETVRLLLEHGADPNLGNSPLYMAVQRGRARAVKMLLQHGADPVEAMKGRNPAKLEGMAKVEAYFGVPWAEIVSGIQKGEDLDKAERAR